MPSANWKFNFLELKDLLKQLNAYVECGDWKNAFHISNILAFKIKMYPQYEEERRRKMKL